MGTTIGGNKVERCGSKKSAIDSFKALYGEKTGNAWEDRKDFKKYPNKFYPLEIDYGQVMNQSTSCRFLSSGLVLVGCGKLFKLTAYMISNLLYFNECKINTDTPSCSRIFLLDHCKIIHKLLIYAIRQNKSLFLHLLAYPGCGKKSIGYGHLKSVIQIEVIFFIQMSSLVLVMYLSPFYVGFNLSELMNKNQGNL